MASTCTPRRTRHDHPHQPRITKELDEIRADPDDLGEWVDVIILAFDGAWRHGWEPDQIIAAIKAKQAKNEARTWPDWRTMSADQAIEHDRTLDGPSPDSPADKPCETCGGTGERWYEWGGKAGTSDPCPSCRGGEHQ